MPTLTEEQQAFTNATPAERKAKVFESWKKEHPEGTQAQFDKEYELVEAIFGE